MREVIVICCCHACSFLRFVFVICVLCVVGIVLSLYVYVFVHVYGDDVCCFARVCVRVCLLLCVVVVAVFYTAMIVW